MPAMQLALTVIDEWLRHQTLSAGLPGLQASIRHKGELVFSKAYGFANQETKEKYMPDHLGQLSSHSKLFTACLALQLQEEGALSLSDLVVDHLPQFRQHPDRRFKKITLRDLLANRSGLCRDGADSPHWELEAPFPSREEVQAEILATDLVYAPNRHTKYSNMGFALLGMALEAAGKADYETLATRYILDRLGKHRLYPQYRSDKKHLFARGHSRKIYDGARKLFKHSATNGLMAATGFCGNTDGISHFLHTLYYTDILLPKKTRRDLMKLKWPMKNLPEDFYGLGTMFSQRDKMMFAGHGGRYLGFTSRTQALLGSDYIFSFISNGNEAFAQNPLRGMAEIIEKIEAVFTPADAATAVVSKPMVNNWGTNLYVVAKDKALLLHLGSWLPVGESIILKRRKDGFYYSDAMQGFGSVGEPVRFSFKGKNIQSVKFGSYDSHPFEDYVKRAKGKFV